MPERSIFFLGADDMQREKSAQTKHSPSSWQAGRRGALMLLIPSRKKRENGQNTQTDFAVE
jgi:hypothetical protein